MKSSRLLAAFVLPISLCCALCLAGCDDSDEDESPAETENGAVVSRSTKPQTEMSVVSDNGESSGDMMTVTDSSEGAFIVQMPAGWKNEAHLVRANGQPRSVGTATSPDGETAFFFGDARAPYYMEPTPQMGENHPLAKSNPMMPVRRYVSAETYFTQYVKNKWGKLPGFRLVGAGPAAAYEQVVNEQLQRSSDGSINLSRRSTTAVSFTYEAKGKPMNALVYGTTLGTEQIWGTDVAGITSTGDPTRYRDLFLRMLGSYRSDTNWKQAEAARNKEQMARSREDHERTMDQIRRNTDDMTRGHNQRMGQIRQFGERNTAAFNQRMGQMDIDQRRRIDSIRGESTVTGSSGTYKVDNSYDRYYVNPNNNTYIGTGSNVEQNDLGRTHGVDPNNYEEVHVKP